MAKSSEAFAWRLYPTVPHICANCKRSLLVKDVAQVHTVYPSCETTFVCTECSPGAAYRRAA